MKKSTKLLGGILITIILAIISNIVSDFIPMHLISAGVFAMLIGMGLFPLVNKHSWTSDGINFVSKKVLRISIILMGITLSFSQVLQVGKYSLIVMTFTLITAFGGGYIFGRFFNMNWKLSNLIAAGTGICGGSAIAAIAPTIEAEDIDIAYAISATFIFDIVMVILFPIMGRFFGMSDMGFGLWTGTAVNDTSSVVAAGYAFSDAAGQYSTIVKLTRTLSIVPIVLIFAYINQLIKVKETGVAVERKKVPITKIFPWFILMFIGMVFLKSILESLSAHEIVSFINSENIHNLASIISKISKFAMVMALGAIGLKSDFKKLYKSGLKPMIHGFIISALVVVVSFGVQYALGQL
ncbi:YeiH family protein [Fusobacterium sp. PH5-44]|uniref:YeiH family protein n=1 Tax=unclassified Fusobacterium TaxID=2648384 RepID=UPI003D1EC9F3